MKAQVILIAALCCLLITGGLMAQDITSPLPPPEVGTSTPPPANAGKATNSRQQAAAQNQQAAQEKQAAQIQAAAAAQAAAPSGTGTQQNQNRQASAVAAVAAAAQAQAASAASSGNGPHSSIGISAEVGSAFLLGIQYESVLGSHLAYTISLETLFGGYSDSDKPRDYSSYGSNYRDDYQYKDFDVSYFGFAAGLRYYFTSPLQGYYIGAGATMSYVGASWDRVQRRTYTSGYYSGSSYEIDRDEDDHGGLGLGAYVDTGYRFLFGKLYLQPQFKLHYHSADLTDDKNSNNRFLENLGEWFFVGVGLTLGWAY